MSANTRRRCTALDCENPVSIGSYMNEPDIINNKYQLHLAMEQARQVIPQVFGEFAQLTGRSYGSTCELPHRGRGGSSISFGLQLPHRAGGGGQAAEAGKKVGVFTANVLRPFPAAELVGVLQGAQSASLSATGRTATARGGGNMSLELKAALQRARAGPRVSSAGFTAWAGWISMWRTR